MIVVYWEDEPQFTVGVPKVNEGFEPPAEDKVVEFIEGAAKLLDATLGDTWWDCGNLRKIVKAAGLPVGGKVPINDDFRRVDVS